MACAFPPVAPTNETTNYARLCCLLVDIGFQALKVTFDRIYAPSTLHSVLASPLIHDTLQALFKGERKILNPAQWIKLFPAIPSSVSSASFDITLLLVLLKNICGLTPPPTGWDALPPESDKSCEADIARLKYYSNIVYGHAKHASVDDVAYTTHWHNIRETLVRLGGATYGIATDNLETTQTDPVVEEHYKELLKQWHAEEYVIKDQLHEMGNDMKYIREQLKILQVSVDKLTHEGRF